MKLNFLNCPISNIMHNITCKYNFTRNKSFNNSWPNANMGWENIIHIFLPEKKLKIIIWLLNIYVGAASIGHAFDDVVSLYIWVCIIYTNEREKNIITMTTTVTTKKRRNARYMFTLSFYFSLFQMFYFFYKY